MEDTKKIEIDKSLKGIIGVVAFLLCVFFFILPIVQRTHDNSIASTGWEIITDKSELSDNANIFTFFTLFFPIAIIVFGFINANFFLFFIISSLGLVSNFLLIININTQDGKNFIPTIFSWIILLFYLGLCGITLFCQLKEKNKVDIGKKCPYCAEQINEEAIICKFCGKDQPKRKDL